MYKNKLNKILLPNEYIEWEYLCSKKNAWNEYGTIMALFLFVSISSITLSTFNILTLNNENKNHLTILIFATSLTGLNSLINYLEMKTTQYFVTNIRLCIIKKTVFNNYKVNNYKIEDLKKIKFIKNKRVNIH